MTVSNETSNLTRTVDGVVVPIPGTYTLDKAHTVVAFVARHLMVTKVRGNFEEFSGSLVVGENPADSSVTAEIEVASITTHEPRRDEHLRSADFFDQENFPKITFKSTKVAPAGDGNWKVTGDLTIRGVTRSVVLDLEFNGAITDPWGGTRLGFSATGEINRQDFGVSFNAVLEGGGVMVGDKIRIEIEAEAVLVA